MDNYRDEIVILDGGFSGQLKKHVNQQIDGDALWTARYLVTHPEAVIQTHLDFLRAGSDVIETNTYQASISGFMKYMSLSKDESYNVIKDSVRLAKTACERFASEAAAKERKYPPLVVGAIGSYGAYLHDGSEYTGSYIQTTSVETMNEYHRPKINALIEGGVDLLAFETIPCRTEAEVLVNLLKNEYSSMKAWLSFSCKDGKSVAHGEDFQETAKYCYNLNPRQLVAVGINCTSPEFSRSLFNNINKEGTETNPIPLVIYPNSGEKYIEGVGWVGKEECKPIESYVKMWLDMGVKWIGGCCRVFAEDITKIRNEVDIQTGRNQ